MDLVRALAIVWCLVVSSLAIGLYIDYSLYGMVAVLAPIVGAVTAGGLAHLGGDNRFRYLSKNVMLVTGFAALMLPLFAVVRDLVTGAIGIAVYLVFIVVALLFADYEDVPVIENERFNGFAIGASVGALLGAAAYQVYRYLGGTGSVVVGYLAANEDVVSMFGRYLWLFMLMLFVVAVPEELLFRVFLMKVGRTAVSTIPAAILSGAMWFALHAVTRVPDYLALAIIGVVGAVVSLLYAMVDFGAAVGAHALYNVAVVLSYELGDIGSLIAVVVGVAGIVYSIAFHKAKLR